MKKLFLLLPLSLGACFFFDEDPVYVRPTPVYEYSSPNEDAYLDLYYDPYPVYAPRPHKRPPPERSKYYPKATPPARPLPPPPPPPARPVPPPPQRPGYYPKPPPPARPLPPPPPPPSRPVPPPPPPSR